MKKIRVAINGFGRIGRSAARIILNSHNIELVAINDIMPFSQMQYLLKYDSTHGVLNKEVELEEDKLIIGQNEIFLFNELDPKELNLSQLNIDILLECSGKFLTTRENKTHIKNGIKKVIMSTPAKDDTPTFIMGVNHETYNNENIISNSSCSGNCIVPIFKIIKENFGIQSAFISTIHSYTSDQNLLECKYALLDIRRARAAGLNIIPVNSSAAKAAELFFPNLKGKIKASSIRVPVPDITLYDLNIYLANNSSLKMINELFINASQTTYKNFISITHEKLVSSDYNHNPFSATIDLNLTQLTQNNLLKITAWQDNEYGYAARLIDMTKYIAAFL